MIQNLLQNQKLLAVLLYIVVSMWILILSPRFSIFVSSRDLHMHTLKICCVFLWNYSESFPNTILENLSWRIYMIIWTGKTIIHAVLYKQIEHLFSVMNTVNNFISWFKIHMNYKRHFLSLPKCPMPPCVHFSLGTVCFFHKRQPKYLSLRRINILKGCNLD